MANMDYIEALTHAIKQGFSCEAKHIKTEHIKEVFKGETVWEGEVEVFEITSHPKAKQAYGWGFREDKKAEFATVLGLPPINNSQDAVKAFIISKTKE
jgi:hypothetical protein